MTEPPPSPARAHFNHAGASIPPPLVVDRVVEHLRLEQQIGGYEAAESVADELAGVAASLAELVGAPAAGIVVVESATRAWEMISWALALSQGWSAGDRVVVDQFAYSSSWGTLLRMRDVVDLDVVVAPTREDGTVDPDRLDEVVDSRTRLVLVTHIPTHLGTVSDVDAVGKTLAARDDVVYAVDVSQSLGQLALDLGTTGCHVAFGPARKFLRGPRGTGFLYVDAELAGSLTPLGVDLTSAATISVEGFEPQAGVRRFELYEHSPALRLGLGRAAEHAISVGPPEIEQLVRRRSEQVVDLIRSTPSTRLLAPGLVSGIVSFVHDRLDPRQVRSVMDAAGVNVWTSTTAGSPIDGERRSLGPSVRVSPHYVTTDADLDALDRGLHSLARA
jgi:cysteine desulfurase / selenocysteine lyase